MSCKHDYRQSEDDWIETWSQVSWFSSYIKWWQKLLRLEKNQSCTLQHFKLSSLRLSFSSVAELMQYILWEWWCS